MENIIAAYFKVESEGYQAITTLTGMLVTDQCGILEMALVKKNHGDMTICDRYNSGIHTTDDTAKGGLIGSLVGVLGGPLGVLIGGSAGALTGNIIDAKDAENTESLIETVAAKMQDEDMALIILAEEADEAILDSQLRGYDAEVWRFDAAVIAEEVEEAKEMEKELARQTRLRLRETKKEERKKNIEEKRNKMAAEFENFKAKLKNKDK